MRSFLRTALVMGALLSALAPAQAQVGTVTQNAVSGNECWNAAQGPGGPSQFLCISQVRNGAAFKLFSGTGTPTYQATESDSTLYWTGTAPTSWTITLPSPAFDGEIVSVASDTTLTSMVTINAGIGQTMNTAFSAQTISATTSAEFQYAASTSKWYRLR